VRRPKHAPVTPDMLERMVDRRVLECQQCLWVTTAIEAKLRMFRTGRCAECNGMLRKSQWHKREETL
jgi:uncharacterized protein with PIN domain